ncbi:GrpB family protein [Streptomyces sp. NPDC056105]|uniref:GrpB family protein n=1 Tax=Streptomyces sp. NPDC056105 TaxID=3345714 RepID=UPI0035E230B0
MPIPDEIGPVAVVDHGRNGRWSSSSWPGRCGRPWVACRCASIMWGPASVPGPAAKDCIDVQIRVRSNDEARDLALLAAIGFRCRPEPWHRTEVSGGIPCRTFVFAPPVGASPATPTSGRAQAPTPATRSCSATARAPTSRPGGARGAFKQRPAASVSDLFDYGQIKAPPPKS